MSQITGLFTQSMNLGDCALQSNSFSSLNYNEVNKSRVHDELLKFYENNLYTDILINVICGDGFVSFPCHKLILSLWSPVFANKFFSNDSKSITDTIEISEVPPSAFEALVKYCYGVKTEIMKNQGDVKYLLKVYKAANIYEIKSLRDLCCKLFSCAEPTKDNVFELLNAAVLTGSDCLKLRCQKVLQDQTREILSSQDLFSITPFMVDTILSLPKLSLHSEYELLNWVFVWGQNEYTKCQEQKLSTTFREIMKPFLKSFNFTSLTSEEFGKLVMKHEEFFNEGEICAIFMNIVCPGSWLLPSWCNNSKMARTFNPNLENMTIS